MSHTTNAAQPEGIDAADRAPRTYARPYTYSVAEILAPLALGTATFPHVVPAPERPTIVPPDEDIEPVGAWIGWPGEGWWCE